MELSILVASATFILLASYLLLPNVENWMAVAVSKRVRETLAGKAAPLRSSKKGEAAASRP